MEADGLSVHRAVSRTTRFGVAALVAYAVIALGGAALNLLAIVLAPLPVAWVLATVDAPALIGLRRDEPHAELRVGPPRSLAAWLVVVGLSMAVGTLGVSLYARNTWDADTARAMSLVTLSLFHLWWALETVLPHRSLRSPQLRDHRALLGLVAASAVAMVLVVSVPALAGLLGIGTLDPDQWLMSLAVSLTIVVLCEVKKALGLLLRGETDGARASRSVAA